MKTTGPVASAIKRNTLILVVLGLISFHEEGRAAVNHSPQWNGPTSLTYNLIDLDGFDPKAYYYCKWGNRLSVNTFSAPTVFLNYNNLTTGPYNNSTTDLFLAQTASFLNRVPFPVDANWAQPNTISFFTANNQLSLYRYLHFRNTLTNHMTGQLVNASTKKLIVLFHGWNPDSNSDSFDNEAFNALLYYLEYHLAGTDWDLIVYHWEPDADTGPLDLSLATNPTEAAEISHQHGQHLGELLLALTPGLEKIHLIAHSAGSWAARSAMRTLMVGNPTVRSELTLLDPYMPTAIVLVNSSLGAPIMSQLDSLPFSDRIFLLENYYADELTFGTQETFAWRANDINQRVDWMDNDFIYFDEHSGPVLWYASTLYAAALGTQPLASLSPFQLTQVGWQRSLFFQEPLIYSDPDSTNISVGESLTLSVGAVNRFMIKNPQSPNTLQYQWRRNGQVVPGGNGPSLSFSPVRVSDSGDYSVVVSNAAGMVASSTATLTVIPSPSEIPRLSLSRPNGGPATVQFNAVPAETYRLQATANLTNWTTILTTNAEAPAVSFTDPDSLNLDRRSYRVAWP